MIEWLLGLAWLIAGLLVAREGVTEAYARSEFGDPVPGDVFRYVVTALIGWPVILVAAVLLWFVTAPARRLEARRLELRRDRAEWMRLASDPAQKDVAVEMTRMLEQRYEEEIGRPMD